MNIGMLWFGNDPKTDLTAKVERAATYYRTKYGHEPTLCFVHPKTGQPCKAAGVDVRNADHILLHHFWMGRGE